MKVSKLRKAGEAILGMLMFVPWAVSAHYIDLGLTDLGLGPHWAVLVASALLGFTAAFVGSVIVIGLARFLYQRLTPAATSRPESGACGH